MADINRVTLVGRLTRDAELRHTSGGLAICSMGLAINRRRKQGDEWVDEANFFDIVLFGRLGEAISQYLTKGRQIGVDGELRHNRWEQDGQRRSKVEIIANNVQLLGGGNEVRSANDASEASDNRATANRAGGSSITSGDAHPIGKENEQFDDDIPF